MKKTIIIIICFFLALPCYAETKFKIYKANKAHKAAQYCKTKLQKHYNETHIPGTPHVFCFVIDTYDNKKAVPLYNTINPPNTDPESDGVVDNIGPSEPPPF